MPNKPRAGAIRKHKKGPSSGTGGLGRKALEGRGPTPKAEDRPYHKAFKAKQAAQRRGGSSSGTSGAASPHTRTRRDKAEEMVTGRNSVLEALQAVVPARTLYVAVRIESDDRVRNILKLAAEQSVPVLQVHKTELDRLTLDAVHQGVALQIPPYEYGDAVELGQKLADQWEKGYLRTAPLIVALDGVTDPRNLGAIIRSVAAFGGHGVVIPERRSATMTATAWKTSAGAAVRVPVNRATNLNRTLEGYRKLGIRVVGLDGDGEISLPSLDAGEEPLCVVVGSEGKGLSRLTRQTCDSIVSIPIDAATESLNASMAVGITLYEVARSRPSA
ncbi:23S rRNA (guanosine(2251)-2'-O)-methyltransferase RlmB [Tersicoccus sp. MR15.9]|uniref:23S rRNA (guanosine(2251)-2'-O)-methyltransferase RlmB n=1 Tax=Tersicoccus mangrovi TaxID=3121635 RepID=UPI002FE59A1B